LCNINYNKLFIMKKLLLSGLLLIGGVIAPMTSSAQVIGAFPYVQDFEAFANCGGSCTSVCALQDFWTNAATATRDYSVDVNGTSSGATGPSVDHTLGTSVGKYLYAETSSPCSPTGTNSWHLNSPQIDLVGANDMQFTFWYHMYGATQGFASVDISNDFGATWVMDIVPTWTDNIDLWQEQSVGLAAYSGDTVILRIRYTSGSSFTGDFAIDDVNFFDLLQDDAGVTAFINPALPTCAFNDSVTVEITNFGTDTLFNANIDWEWNAAAQTTLAWTGTLAQGESQNVYLGSVVYGPGDNLKAWTSLPNGVIESPTGAGNDTTEILSLSAGLSGIYTVGGLTPDYVDFATAITSLNTFGVCGPTTFDVRTGTYPEQVSLGSVIGMDATNTVTFRSEAGHRDSVIVEFTPTTPADNYIVLMDGADHFNFEQMTLRNLSPTYGHVLDVQGGSDWNTFWDLRFHSVTTFTTSTNMAVVWSNNSSNDNYNSFLGNTIEGGSYGTYWYGSGTASLEMGSVFDGNEFVNQYYYGSRLYYMDAPVFTNNTIENTSAYTGTMYGFYFVYCDNGAVITHNTVRGSAIKGWGYGIYLSQCDGNAGSRGLVANNMVHSGQAGSTTTIYGIYVTSTGYFDFYNNSVLTVGAGTSSRSLYVTSGGANQVMNNNLVNLSGGYAVYLGDNYTVVAMDNNNLWSPGGTTGFYSGNQVTLGDWQTASGYDANGLNVDPGFVSEFDLHVCSDSLDGKAQPLAFVTDDIDGQPRDAGSPDIGADEFTPLNGNFLGADAAICTGASIALWAGSPLDTLLWSTGDTTNMIMVSTPGTYDVIVDGPCGIYYDTIVVSASALNYTNFLVADTLQFCSGGSAILSSSMPADTYSWTGGTSLPTLTVTVGGTYDLDITDGCGSGSESIVVTELFTPTASFTSVTSFVTASFTNTSGATGSVTYAWDFGDTGTSTLENPSHIYSLPGSYFVTLTVTNECGSNVISDSVTVSTVGLNELFANGDVQVYPNPSNGNFTISMDMLASTDVEIRVENMLGQIVYQSNPGVIAGTHTEEIALGSSPAGMYFVRVLAGGQQLVKKVIID
jgi:PKD repeat protein